MMSDEVRFSGVLTIHLSGTHRLVVILQGPGDTVWREETCNSGRWRPREGLVASADRRKSLMTGTRLLEAWTGGQAGDLFETWDRVPMKEHKRVLEENKTLAERLVLGAGVFEAAAMAQYNDGIQAKRDGLEWDQSKSWAWRRGYDHEEQLEAAMKKLSALTERLKPQDGVGPADPPEGSSAQRVLTILAELYKDEALGVCYNFSFENGEGGPAPLEGAILDWADAGFPGVPQKDEGPQVGGPFRCLQGDLIVVEAEDRVTTVDGDWPTADDLGEWVSHILRGARVVWVSDAE